MPEPVSIILGLAIGKAVFKAWFKDNEFVGSMSDSIGDLVGKVIPDWQARSAANRQIGRMSEKAASALEPLIQIEWAGLDHGEKSEAVHQVQSAIELSGINSKIIASANFEPVNLRNIILFNLNASMLNVDAAQLALRLVDESSQLIIDISSSLPEFQRETFAEILLRESAIIESIDSLFVELDKIRNMSRAQTAVWGGAEFEENYRRAAARKLDRIELFGLNASSNPTSRQHNLTTAYISLSVTGASLVSDNDNDKGTPGQSGLVNRPHTLSGIRAEEAATIASRVVIKGEAGSGKTTLLQSLAVRAATAAFNGDMINWNSLVPFFISLRALPDGTLPAPEEFPKLIAPAISGTMPKGWVHEQLNQGRGLILIDGLDEISEQRRNSTRQWIEELIGSYPDCRILVTSRPPAIPDGWLSSQKFAEIELLPMSPDDVSTFIEHWHEAVAGEEQDEVTARQTRTLSGKLRERIRSDRALRELAATPLLCAMLCAMNRDRKEVLPSNRIALYDAATQLILHGRDEQRQVNVADLPTLSYETKRDILQDIAFWMMENGFSMADEWRIVGLVRSIIPRFPRIPSDLEASLIFKALIHRSGLLRSPVDGQCDFVHNAFKEFLCARAVSDGDKFGFLVGSIAESEAWREVAPMAAAITDDKRRSAFLTELLRRGDVSPSRRVMYHLLAVRCLETCTQLDPEIQSHIKQRISGLRPPHSIGEAKALSAAGDLAAHLLKKTPGQVARTAASCVRTLRLIGTEQSLEYLEAYGPDTRSTVVKELIAAWPFFDRTEYARKVLSRTRGFGGGLRIDSLDGIEGLRYLSHLQNLTVNAYHREIKKSHLSEITDLTQLTNLSLRSIGGLDVEGISTLRKLTTLRIDVKNIENVDRLSDMPNLSILDIIFKEPTAVTDCRLPAVTRLNILGPMRADRDSIKVGNKLKIMFAPSVSSEFDTSFLKSAIRLERLALPLSNLMSTYTYNIPWTLMKGLFAFDAKSVASLSFIPDMPKLESLGVHLAHNLGDLSGVERFPALTLLNISGAKLLHSISSIASLSELSDLSISASNEEIDIRVLRDLPKLRIISAPAALLRKIRQLGLRANLRAILPPPS